MKASNKSDTLNKINNKYLYYLLIITKNNKKLIKNKNIRIKEDSNKVFLLYY